MEHAGREERLPSDAAVGEVGSHTKAEATEYALDIVDVHGPVGKEERTVSLLNACDIQRVDGDPRPHDAAGRLDEPAAAQGMVVADVAGQGDAVRVELLTAQTVVAVGQLVLEEVPANLAVQEEAAPGEGRVDADERHVRVLAERAGRRCQDAVEPGETARREIGIAEGACGCFVFGPRLEVAGGDAPVPVGSRARSIQDRDVVSDLVPGVVLSTFVLQVCLPVAGATPPAICDVSSTPVDVLLTSTLPPTPRTHTPPPC